MATLKGYKQFGGRHHETGTLHNVLAYQGVKAPHTGRPFSEAMLLGLSGGIAVLYFVFEYKGFDPHLYLGTRNTFDPLQAILQRLRIKSSVKQTANPKAARDHLSATLEAGKPAIVWADRYGLGYTSEPDAGFPGTIPLVVYGYDEQASAVQIADRAGVPLTVKPEEFAKARARQGTVKHRLMTLEPPANFNHLPGALNEALLLCLELFTGKPPKGPAGNFGLAALDKWASLLDRAKEAKSWARVFPPGRRMYDALKRSFENVELEGTGGSASRPMFAQFLMEAAVVLQKPKLKPAAAKFRANGKRWSALAEALLPESVQPFRETRELTVKKDRLFQEQGGASLGERKEIEARLVALRGTMDKDFPLSTEETAALRGALAERVRALRTAEAEAALAMKEALS